MDYQIQAIKAIETQQAKVKYHSNQWLVGEQLKDICRLEPKSAALLVEDLQVQEMSIASAEKKIAEFAKKNSGRVETMDADRILRKFYGLPKPDEIQKPLPEPVPAPPPVKPEKKFVDLDDFL